MPGYCANLGFLWPQLDLCSSIIAASKAGFYAVECHWPFDVPADKVRDALTQASIPMICLNTFPGDQDAGEFGLAAITGRHKQAREYIDQALEYADQIHCSNVHVMAGKSSTGECSQATFIDNLNYACQRAAEFEITVLIEAINTRDVVGYHLNTIEAAVETVLKVNQPNLKLMFDCYHVQTMQGDIVNRIRSSIKHIGHIQIASVPDRAEPDHGELNYPYIINSIYEMGYQGFIGVEYNPSANTDDSLGWLREFKITIP